MRVIAFFTAALVLAAAATSARQSAPPPATFKSGVDLIELDVSVLDKARHPVRGLTAADFTILEDGKSRRVASFKAIDVPPTVAPTAPWIRDVAPDVVVNAPVLGRVLLIVIDDASFDQVEPDTTEPLTDIRAIQKAREVARTVVRDMGPADVASVIFTDNNYTAQDFSTDRAKLLAAIDNAALFPGPQTPPPSIDPARGGAGLLSVGRGSGAAKDWLGNTRGSCYCGLCTADTLARASEMLRDQRGQRKTMFFISSGIAYTMTGSPDELPPTLLERQCAGRRLAGTMDLLRQAQRSNVTIHAIDPKGLIVGNFDPVGADHQMIEFNRTLAETTGGRAVVNNNDPETQVQTLLDEGASYYLLGFESGSTAADGREHSLKVRVNRSDVEVIARNSYSVPTVKEVRMLEAKRGAPGSLDEATSSIMPKTDVKLAAVLAPFASTDGRPTLAIVLDVAEPVTSSSRGPRPEKLSITARAFGPQGNDKGSTGGTIDLTVTPHGDDPIVLEAFMKLALAPGRYSIRLGARTGDGLTGSVYPSIDVPDFAGDPLSLSGLVVTASRTSNALLPDTFAGLLPVVPTGRREFSIDDDISTLVRVYQGGNRPVVPVTVTTTIVDSANTEVVHESKTVAAAGFGPSRTADVRYAPALDKLAPGEYLLRVAADAGKSHAERAVRFTVK